MRRGWRGRVVSVSPCEGLGLLPECVRVSPKTHQPAEWRRRLERESANTGRRTRGFSVVLQEIWWLGPAWGQLGGGDPPGLDSACILAVVLLQVTCGLASTDA